MSAGAIELTRGDGDAIEILPDDWRRAVGLAALGGWRAWSDGPACLRHPGAGDDAVYVSAAQAQAFAAALDRALADVPRHDARRHKLVAHPADAAVPGWWTENPRTPVSPLEHFSGASRDLPADLAAFLRRGPCVARFVPW